MTIAIPSIRFPLTRSTVPDSAFNDKEQKRRFPRQALDTEFIEVQGQP
jgi:hypothetical protein